MITMKKLVRLSMLPDQTKKLFVTSLQILPKLEEVIQCYSSRVSQTSKASPTIKERLESMFVN
jgi:hypothetical protein